MHRERKTGPMTAAMRDALARAASTKGGLISAGHGYATAKSTLIALARRGYVEFVASDPTYYAQRYQYKLTPAGVEIVELIRRKA